MCPGDPECSCQEGLRGFRIEPSHHLVRDQAGNVEIPRQQSDGDEGEGEGEGERKRVKMR